MKWRIEGESEFVLETKVKKNITESRYSSCALSGTNKPVYDKDHARTQAYEDGVRESHRVCGTEYGTDQLWATFRTTIPFPAKDDFADTAMYRGVEMLKCNGPKGEFWHLNFEFASIATKVSKKVNYRKPQSVKTFTLHEDSDGEDFATPSNKRTRDATDATMSHDFLS